MVFCYFEKLTLHKNSKPETPSSLAEALLSNSNNPSFLLISGIRSSTEIDLVLSGLAETKINAKTEIMDI